jgi:hypothetical protein
MSDWVNYAGEICKSKDGNGRYIKINKDFKAMKGNNIIMVKFEDYLQGLVDSGKITKDDMERRIEKVTWVQYVLHVPPQEFKEKDESKHKNGWINDAIELRKSKAGNLYLAITKDFSGKKDCTIPLTKYSEKIEQLAAKGFLNDDQLQQKKQVATWLYYVGSIPPNSDTIPF